MKSNTLLELKNVSFSYGKTDYSKILSNISFSVKKGSVLAVVGSSGSGKSTILNLIAGILPTSGNTFSGQVFIEGLTPNVYLKGEGLSFMFQTPTLFPNLTVEENIRLPLQIRQLNTTPSINTFIETVGLNAYRHYYPRQLSGGMRTRVALARSFITKPKLLLMDEPFSALDVAWKDTLFNELRQLMKNYGTTVILVTHDISEAIELADTIICLGIRGELLKQENTDVKEDLYAIIKNEILSEHSSQKEYGK